MALITRLVASKGRYPVVKVYLDGQYSFSLEPAVALKANLKPQSDLPEDQAQQLLQANNLWKCMAAAESLIAQRPRSEAELRQRLLMKSFDEESVEKAIVELTQRGLADDVAFARYWTENRSSFRPRSRNLVQSELRRKGVALDVAKEAIAELDDAESAYVVGAKKARLIKSLSRQEFNRKLGDYLQRRGYDYSTIRSTITRLWQETVQEELGQ